MAGSVRRREWPLHGRSADAALAAATAVVVFVGTILPAGPGAITALGWAMMLVACAAVYFRRTHPLTATLVTLVGTATYLLTPGQDGPIVVTFAIMLYTLIALGRLVAGLTIGLVAVLGTMYGEYASDTDHLGDLGVVFFAAWLITVMAVGGAVYNRRAYLREAEQRMLEADRNREEELLRRTIEERLNIARELHDVLGHTISLINVQASASLHRIGKDPGQASEALSTIKDSSHDALRELRSTLGVLRQVEEAAPTAPAPSLSRVSELAARSESGELAVRTEIDGEPPATLPPAVDLAGYRIVQEALTNVARHSGAASATVYVEYRPDEVRLDIADDGRGGRPGDTSGSGVVGMRERAESLGGTLEAEPRAEGGFRVRATLPLSAASNGDGTSR